jgi:hypothetical protein
MNNRLYESFTDKQKEVAPQIEKLINGLSISEINYLFLRIKRKIQEETKVEELASA